MNNLWTVEFNPKTGQFRQELLVIRVRQNVLQLLNERKVRESNWVLIAAVQHHFVWRYIEVFQRRWDGARFSEQGTIDFLAGKTNRLL